MLKKWGTLICLLMPLWGQASETFQVDSFPGLWTVYKRLDSATQRTDVVALTYGMEQKDPPYDDFLLIGCDGNMIGARFYVGQKIPLMTNISITLQIDNGKAIEGLWAVTEEGAIENYDAPELIKSLLGKKVVTINVPFNDNFIVERYSLSGADKAIAEVKASCRIK